MGVTRLARDGGMLFLFPHQVGDGFWMKGTLIPLDIAFVRRGVVVHTATMTPCHVSACPLTTPPQPYDEAIELAAGTFAHYGVHRGAEVLVAGAVPTPI